MLTARSHWKFACIAGATAFVGWFVLIIGRQVMRGYRIVPAKMDAFGYWLINTCVALVFATLAALLVWLFIAAFQEKMK